MKRMISVFLSLIFVFSLFSASGSRPAEAAASPYGTVPILIGDPETDLMADQVLATINTAGLNDREKILKVYDWIILHSKRIREDLQYEWIEGPSVSEVTAYSAQMQARLAAGQAVLRQNLSRIYTDYTYGENQWSYHQGWLDSNEVVKDSANWMMHTYAGTCVDFAGLFAVLLGHLGYDARTVSGAYINNSGPVAHTWNYVLIGNQYYWFDIRIDHSISQGSSTISHAYFMKSDTNEWARNHIWARGYTDLLASHVSDIKTLYGTDASHTHVWRDNMLETEATCEEAGLWVQTCTVCGLRQVRYQAMGHDWSVLSEYAPTCTDEGSRYLFCDRCFARQEETIPPTGHTWQLQEVLTPPQGEEHGTASYLCQVCGEEKTARLCASEIFTDAPKETNWAHAGVDYCLYRGLMTGTSATTFSPSGTMTRAMLVQILWAAEDKPTSAASGGFTDVRPGAWYEQAVNWAAETGLVSGVGEGKFAPNQTLNRQTFATILLKYAAYKWMDTEAQADLSGYPDADRVSGWAQAAMEWAVGSGLISGVASGETVRLAPRDAVTRAMTAVILMKFLTQSE